ncbi:MAG: HEPN domain-containing protein [Actinobacteria bacterium]|nr:HEPN domain-containing protein [Actinomycetota bacterium]
MPLDPARAGEAYAWLAKAAQDLRAADVDLAAVPPLAEDAAFHAQQAAEKSLSVAREVYDRISVLVGSSAA